MVGRGDGQEECHGLPHHRVHSELLGHWLTIPANNKPALNKAREAGEGNRADTERPHQNAKLNAAHPPTPTLTHVLHKAKNWMELIPAQWGSR